MVLFNQLSTYDRKVWAVTMIHCLSDFVPPHTVHLAPYKSFQVAKHNKSVWLKILYGKIIQSTFCTQIK